MSRFIYYNRVKGGKYLKESRLFKIVYYILENGRITAPELAEKFEVSVRTIYRDIDVISSAGIPIYVTTGRNGGIQILENYVLDKALFSEKEKQDILAALQSVSVVSNTYEKDGLQCPYIPNCIEQVQEYCTKNNIPLNLIAVDTLEKAKNLPCIFNNWAVFYHREYETNHLLNETFLKKKFQL